MKMTNSSTSPAFSLLELCLVIAFLGLLGLFVLPLCARRQIRSSRVNCVNNLKQIGLAFRTWALDNQDKYPMQVSVTNGGTMELVNSGPAFVHYLVMSNELSTPKILICPEEPDPSRINATTFGQLASLPQGQIPFTNDNHLSYFVGVDANETLPGAFLSGDRNLAIDRSPLRRGMQRIWTNSAITWFAPRPRHSGGGNIGLADGSVQSLSDKAFPILLSQTGMATNRLVMP